MFGFSLPGFKTAGRSALGAYGLCLAGALLPTVAMLRPLGAALLIALAGLLALAGTWKIERPWLKGPRLLHAALALTVIWGLISSVWSINPLFGLRTALAFGATGLAGLALAAAACALDRDGARTVARVAVIGLCVAQALALFEILTGGLLVHTLFGVRNFDGPGRFVLNRGSTILALGTWPALWLLRHCGWRRWKAIAAAMAALTFYDVTHLASQAAAGGFVLGGLVSMVTAFIGRAGPRIGAALLIALLLAMPGLTRFIPDPVYSWEHYYHLMKNSTHHRLTIWRFTGERIAEHPIRGWGLESARDIPNGEVALRLTHQDPGEEEILTLEQMMPLHPHNLFLQWWLELGLPGALLVSAIVWAAACAASAQRTRWSVGLAFATLVVAFGVSAVSYGAWQMWWTATLWMMAAFCTVAAKLDPP